MRGEGRGVRGEGWVVRVRVHLFEASVPVLSVSRYEMTPSSSGSVEVRTCSPGSRLSEGSSWRVTSGKEQWGRGTGHGARGVPVGGHLPLVDELGEVERDAPRDGDDHREEDDEAHQVDRGLQELLHEQ